MHIERNDQIKISVIMPVHNTGIYLEESLNSIFAQSFHEFELICVDDASDDELTKNILYSFQSNYENMQVITLKNNVGAARARNTGFQKAGGEYVIFLDADDLFADDMLEKMYQSVRVNHADVCICGYQAFYIENGEKYFGEECLPNEYKVNCTDREDWFLSISTEPWNKLCKVQFLKEHGIYFQSLSSCNDVFYSCMVMVNAEKRCYVECSMVFYRTKIGTQISANRNPVDLYRAVMKVNTLGNKKVDKALLLKWCSVLLLWNGIGELQKSRNVENKRQFYDLLKEYFVRYPINFHNNVFNACMDHVKKLPYESEWFCRRMDFLEQLRLTADKLKKELSKDSGIFLWGLGCRGNAFQQFCQEEDIRIHGAADIEDTNVGYRTKYGNEIVSTAYVLQREGIIVASNKRIYESLIGKELNSRLLNLEEYCPM